MDWDGSLSRSSFVNSRPESSNTTNAAASFSSFLFNYSFDQFPGNNMEKKHHHPFGMVPESSSQGSGLGAEKYSGSSSYIISGGHQERNKKLTSEQLESLERSFQEEIKLDPDRKMKLSRELGLQPRQIAVWFQNRRARWKAKQLERLYDALKQEFDAISRDKLRLQEEVFQLKSMIRDQAAAKKNTAGFTELSGEETVESTSINIHTSYTKRPRKAAATTHHHQVPETTTHHHQVPETSFMLGNEYNTASYWGIVPSAYNNTNNNIP